MLSERVNEYLAQHRLELVEVYHRPSKAQAIRYAKFRCSCGNIVDRRAEPRVFTSSFPGCQSCFERSKPHIVEQHAKVREHLATSQATFIEVERDAKNTSVRFACACGTEVTRRLNQVLASKVSDCEDCRIARLPKGADAPGFKHGLSREARGLTRGALQQRWARACIRRDKACVISGEIDRQNLTVHHLWSFTRYPLLRFEKLNGVTLHRDLHRLFHKRYGVREFTPWDFAEFYRQQTGKEFDMPELL